MKKAPEFHSEADLCAAFLAWARCRHPEVEAYAEWAGWDILLVHRDGWQLGIQAKLRLNAEVIGQAAPDTYSFEVERIKGPDYRGLLVPALNPLGGIAARLGLEVFWPRRKQWSPRGGDTGLWDFTPDLKPHPEWLDWNPRDRHALPPTPTDAIAGSPCPVSLTPWKLGALDVLAEVEVRGKITSKRIKRHGIDPGRWLQGRWLEPAETRGDWVRGARCPKFDEQHPSAYALALQNARSAAAAEVPEIA